MQSAICVLCQERVNLLTQKLVSVQWIESETGTLLTLPFHSDCYARWYRETAQGSKGGRTEAASSPGSTNASGSANPPSAPGTPAQIGIRAMPSRAAALPKPEPELDLTEAERQRLESLRGKRDSDAQPVIKRPPESSASDASGATGAPAAEGDASLHQTRGPADGINDQDQHAPEHDDPQDGHDVPPPHV